MKKQILFTASLLLVGGSAFAATSGNTDAFSASAGAITVAQNDQEEPSAAEKAKRSKEVEGEAKSAADKAKANANMPEKSDPTASSALPAGGEDGKDGGNKPTKE